LLSVYALLSSLRIVIFISNGLFKSTITVIYFTSGSLLFCFFCSLITIICLVELFETQHYRDLFLKVGMKIRFKEETIDQKCKSYFLKSKFRFPNNLFSYTCGWVDAFGHSAQMTISFVLFFICSRFTDRVRPIFRRNLTAVVLNVIVNVPTTVLSKVFERTFMAAPGDGTGFSASTLLGVSTADDHSR